jgi:hypothetical protein
MLVTKDDHHVVRSSTLSGVLHFSIVIEEILQVPILLESLEPILRARNRWEQVRDLNPRLVCVHLLEDSLHALPCVDIVQLILVQFVERLQHDECQGCDPRRQCRGY